MVMDNCHKLIMKVGSDDWKEEQEDGEVTVSK